MTITHPHKAVEIEVRRGVFEALLRSRPGRSIRFYVSSMQELFPGLTEREIAEDARDLVAFQKDGRQGEIHWFPGDSDPAERRIVYTTEDPARRVLTNREADHVSRNLGPARVAPTTAWEFLASRARWLEVNLTEHSPGSFNVTLRLDGSYSDSESGSAMAEEMADFLQDSLRSILLDGGGESDR